MTKITMTGGGMFDRAERHAYFLAADPGSLQIATGQHRYLLIPVDALMSDEQLPLLESWIAAGTRVLLDSGVFSFASAHARRHGISHDEALSLAPNQIDNFDVLLDRYTYLTRRFGDGLWGYIEIDFGGMENKIKTRAMLEGMGLRPIPVYHPLIDGWDYFNYLASRYDRICVGNVVHADRKTRLRITSTVWQRRQQYPHLWMHLLGLTPNEWLSAYPVDSADSSTWLGSTRWGVGQREATAGKSFSNLPRGFIYRYEAERDAPDAHPRARALGAYLGGALMTNWRAVRAAYQRELGDDESTVAEPIERT